MYRLIITIENKKDVKFLKALIRRFKYVLSIEEEEIVIQERKLHSLEELKEISDFKDKK
jgi:hypothetical protein